MTGGVGGRGRGVDINTGNGYAVLCARDCGKHSKSTHSQCEA